MRMYPSYTSIYQHIPSCDGISRYMSGYQGVRNPNAHILQHLPSHMRKWIEIVPLRVIEKKDFLSKELCVICKVYLLTASLQHISFSDSNASETPRQR